MTPSRPAEDQQSDRDPPYILPLADAHVDLQTAGGKAASLARIARAGLAVPDGFIVTTEAYRQFTQHAGLDQVIADALDETRRATPVDMESLSIRLRAAFADAPLPEAIAAELRAAYARLGGGPVAVRSSATAEDLPDLSFAGQQDTYLNVIGESALFKAVVDCWSSLWTARAIGYRQRNDIPQEGLALAVILQHMVSARASGVLFTANPLTGKRDEMVLDATLGLGEALVSGQVDPDHYLIGPDGDIISKTLGTKAVILSPAAGGGLARDSSPHADRAALPDAVIPELAAIGKRVAALYGAPQDIEWAWDGGRLYLLQSRPITSLFPIPEGLPTDPLHVLISFGAIQGVMKPFTPLGSHIIRLLIAGAGRSMGYHLDHESQRALFSAGARLWVNITPLFRNTVGRRLMAAALPAIAPGAMGAIRALLDDPRLQPERRGIRPVTALHLARLILPMWAMLIRIWARPERAAQRILDRFDSEVSKARARAAAVKGRWERLSRAVSLTSSAYGVFPDVVIPHGLTGIVAGMVPFFGILRGISEQAARAAGDPALGRLYLEIARGLPHNVTTEMDLALWDCAEHIRSDPQSKAAFLESAPAQLSARYKAGSLPRAAQQALVEFLQRYGPRGVGEIDIGRPRWSEDPAHIVQVLQGYLGIEDPSRAPDAVFARGAAAAQEAARRLEAAARTLPQGWFKARLVRWAVRRYRALAGLREAPKFFAVRMIGLIRQALLDAGEALAAVGILQHADDVFFFTLNELLAWQGVLQSEGQEAARAHAAALHERVTERRTRDRREMSRRQIPRLLLSDGTAFYEGMQPEQAVGGSLLGDPVSPGVVEGRVHVAFDPLHASLAPGDILVCPGTDPAWTPLFLTAGGLVMEVGGMMTHGSVVAREYGIPAVVGVNQATTRLKNGMRVRVNGSSGNIQILDGPSESDDPS